MSEEIADPKKTETIWVWIAEDEGGSESIPATKLPNEMVVPLVATSEENANIFRGVAEQARAQGLKVSLIKFSTRETIEELP